MPNFPGDTPVSKEVNTTLGSYTSIHGEMVPRPLYSNLMKSRERATTKNNQLRSAIADAMALLENGDSENATAILRAALFDTTLIVKNRADEDCGCGEK